MATDDTSSQPTERHINWGGVLKGAAIVVGVAVAAVVGYWAVVTLAAPALAALSANTAAGTLATAAATTAHTGAAYAAHGAGWVIGSLVHLASGIPAGLVQILGLPTQHFAQTAAVSHLAGIGGAAVAGAVATHAAVPYFEHTHFTSPGDAGVMATQTASVSNLAPSLPMHDLTHITHHAASHADEHASAAWTQRFAPRMTGSASFADQVRTGKPERKPAPPADNFIDQLNTDRANLDAALAK